MQSCNYQSLRARRFALGIIVLFGSCLSVETSQRGDVLNKSRQCIIVITDSWNATHGVLQRFERGAENVWHRVSGEVPIITGRAGLGWGRGEVDPQNLTGPTKREGDGKAPAGVFQLGTACGFGHKPRSIKLPYLRLSKNTLAIDDPASRYYNQIVDVTKVAKPDWHSVEKPVPTDIRYKWSIVVVHNMPPVAGKGSCVFLHLWKDQSTPTSGCTAMSEDDLLTLFGWLDPAARPLLVQLPRSIYNRVRRDWELPQL
jgi:zinc D-Ala-D-Ala dipeptidase